MIDQKESAYYSVEEGAEVAKELEDFLLVLKALDSVGSEQQEAYH